MAYSRTDVLHLSGSIPQAMSTLCATATALKWTLDSQDADTASWSVAHGLLDWKIKVCANFLESGGVTTVQITSHSDELGSQGHVDEAAVALEGPAQAALSVFSHFGSPLPWSTPPQPAPAAPSPPVPRTIPTTWEPGTWSSSFGRAPISPPPGFTPPAWTQFQPPSFHPWPVIVSGGGQVEETPEGGSSWGSGGSGGSSGGSSGSGGGAPIDSRPLNPSTPPTSPLDPFNMRGDVWAANQKARREEQRTKIVNQIDKVSKRLAGGLGPIQRKELEHNLTHLRDWLGKVGTSG